MWPASTQLRSARSRPGAITPWSPTNPRPISTGEQPCTSVYHLRLEPEQTCRCCRGIQFEGTVSASPYSGWATKGQGGPDCSWISFCTACCRTPAPDCCCVDPKIPPPPAKPGKHRQCGGSHPHPCDTPTPKLLHWCKHPYCPYQLPPPPPLSSKNLKTDDSSSPLAGLPALTKPHYSWGRYNLALNGSGIDNRATLVDYARITSAFPVVPAFSETAVRKAVGICQDAIRAGGGNCSLSAPLRGERLLRLGLKIDDEQRSRPSIPLHIDWATELTRTRTAATVEVDVMPFLGRTGWGGPFDKYYEALENLGAEFVRMAPWWPNPRVVVTELKPSDCTPTKPATNWNSTLLDQVMADFYHAVCGPKAKQGGCEKSVIQQWSTWPSYMFTDGFNPKDLDPRPWVPNMAGSADHVYGLEGSKLRDPSCGQVAGYFGRAVGWYTRGGFVDECGHNHTSGLHYNWHGLSVFNEDEHGLSPEGGIGYSRCFDVIAKEVHRINPEILLVGPETVAGDGNTAFLIAFMNASNHRPEVLVDEHTSASITSLHWGCNAHSRNGDYFFETWDTQMLNASYKATQCCDQGSTKCLNNLEDNCGAILALVRNKAALKSNTELAINEFIVSVDDWCDCTGVEHLCVGGCSGSHPQSDGGDPDLAHMKGIKPNKNTTTWNSAAAVFAYAFGTLAEHNFKYLGIDQLIGGTWPDNCAGVTSLDWQTGAPNAKYYVTQLLARTVGSSAEKIIYTVAASHYDNVENARAVYALPYELLTAGGGKPGGAKGLMLVNKRNYSLSITIPGVVGGEATVVEATGATPGWQVPTNRSFATDGSLKLGPYAVAVAPVVQLAHDRRTMIGSVLHSALE